MRKCVVERRLHREHDVELRDHDEVDVGAPAAAREQDGFRPGLRGGDEETAVASTPRHGQAGGIEVGIGCLQQFAIRRLADQIDERQVEVQRVSFVVEPRLDPVARKQRIAEPHVPRSAPDRPPHRAAAG